MKRISHYFLISSLFMGGCCDFRYTRTGPDWGHEYWPTSRIQKAKDICRAQARQDFEAMAKVECKKEQPFSEIDFVRAGESISTQRQDALRQRFQGKLCKELEQNQNLSFNSDYCSECYYSVKESEKDCYRQQGLELLYKEGFSCKPFQVIR